MPVHTMCISTIYGKWINFSDLKLEQIDDRFYPHNSALLLQTPSSLILYIYLEMRYDRAS